MANTIIGQTSNTYANTIAISVPDLVKYAGDIIHIENLTPITRSPIQTETLQLVLGYN